MRDNLERISSMKKSSLQLWPHTGLVPEIWLFDLFLLFYIEKGTEFMPVQSKLAMASSSLSSSIHCASSRCWSVPKLTKVLLQEKSCPTTKLAYKPHHPHATTKELFKIWLLWT